MNEFIFYAKIKQVNGSNKCRYFRKNHQIPAIIYGKKKPNINILLTNNKLFNANNIKLLCEKSTKVILKINDNNIETVQIKALQRHPFKPNIIHVDFMRI